MDCIRLANSQTAEDLIAIQVLNCNEKMLVCILK